MAAVAVLVLTRPPHRTGPSPLGGGIRNGRAAPGVVDPVTIRRTRPPAFRYDAGAQRRCAAPPNWLPSTVPTPIAAVVTKASTA